MITRLLACTFQTYTSHTIDSRVSSKGTRKRRTMAKLSLVLLAQCTLLWTPKWIYELRWYFTLEPLTYTWYLVQLFGVVAVYINACLTPFTAVMCCRAFRHQLGKVCMINYNLIQCVFADLTSSIYSLTHSISYTVLHAMVSISC